MTVISAIYMPYVYKERADVELDTKEMVSNVKRVSVIRNAIERNTSIK